MHRIVLTAAWSIVMLPALACAADYPRTPNTHLERACLLQRSGDLSGAEAECRAALREGPSHQGYCMLGSILAAKGEAGKAVTAFRDALQCKADSVEALYGLAIVLRQDGQTGEAFEALRKAVILQPDQAELHTALGVLYGERGLFNDAISEHRKAINLREDMSESYYNLAIAFWAKGERFGACAAARHAIRLRPDDGEARQLLHSYREQISHKQRAMWSQYAMWALWGLLLARGIWGLSRSVSMASFCLLLGGALLIVPIVYGGMRQLPSMQLPDGGSILMLKEHLYCSLSYILGLAVVSMGTALILLSVPSVAEKRLWLWRLAGTIGGALVLFGIIWIISYAWLRNPTRLIAHPEWAHQLSGARIWCEAAFFACVALAALVGRSWKSSWLTAWSCMSSVLAAFLVFLGTWALMNAQTYYKIQPDSFHSRLWLARLAGYAPICLVAAAALLLMVALVGAFISDRACRGMRLVGAVAAPRTVDGSEAEKKTEKGDDEAKKGLKDEAE